jgi:hypothetical protein
LSQAWRFLQGRRDVNPIAHKVAITLLDHVAEMDADAKLNTTLRGEAGVSFYHATLHLDGASHGIDHASKFDEASVTSALNNAPVMHGNGGIDQVATQRPQPRQRPILVGAGEPAIAGHIRRQDCR